MKEVLAPLGEEGVLFRRFEPFDLKGVGSRKRIGVYHGIDTEGRYILVFDVDRKSRILQKEVKEWLELKKRIEEHFGYTILQPFAIVKAPLCSRAKALLESEGWRVLTP
jgi:hypothetical protein